VYNPLVYARPAWAAYVARYGRRPRPALLLGMNPGPHGMVQTGIPFGEVGSARDWLGLSAEIGRPEPEHPRRPVTGFACTRREVSGARVWGWIRDRFGTPERFFAVGFVANHCPLAFFDAAGTNLTPDRLARADREPILAACDAALRDTVAVLGSEVVVGVGRFAEARAREAIGDRVRVIGIPHPSPANPAANRGWGEQVDRILGPLGLAGDKLHPLPCTGPSPDA
jgi:single-strand selective monofunctional uracil DNA glycosylase